MSKGHLKLIASVATLAALYFAFRKCPKTECVTSTFTVPKEGLEPAPVGILY